LVRSRFFSRSSRYLSFCSFVAEAGGGAGAGGIGAESASPVESAGAASGVVCDASSAFGAETFVWLFSGSSSSTSTHFFAFFFELDGAGAAEGLAGAVVFGAAGSDGLATV
jgi:hypothetical protein